MTKVNVSAKTRKAISIVLTFFLLLSLELSAAPKKKINEQTGRFSSYPEEFASIADRALSLTQEGNYASAIDAFSRNTESGTNAWTYGKETWESQNSFQKAERVTNLVSQIQKYCEDYKALQTQFNSIVISENSARNLNSIIPAINRMADIRNKISGAAVQISKEGSFGYPSNLVKFISGVPEEKYSGIIGTIDAQWDSIVLGLENILIEQNLSENEKLNALINEKNLFDSTENITTAKKSLKLISDNCSSLKKIHELNKKILLNDGKTKADLISDFNDSMDTLSALMKESENIWNVADRLINENSVKLSKPADVAKALRSKNDAYSTNLVDTARNYVTYGNIAAAGRKTDLVYRLNGIKEEQFRWSDITKTFQNLCTKIELTSQKNSIELWVKVAELYSEAADAFLSEDSEKFKICESYINGKSVEIFATKCLNETAQLKILCESDIAVLEECKTKMNDGYAYRSNFIQQQNLLNEDTDKIKQLLALMEKTESDARKRQVIALTAKNEIDIYYNNSLSFHKANNFNQSFTQLQKAQNSYSSKISELANDADIQNELFKRISQLRQSIIDKERPVFMSEIRKFKNNARIEYYAGNFEEANSLLSQADAKREMWAKLMDVEMESDSELERLKDFVITALTIKEGREISDWDSKAPEMKQNLSFAKKYFNEGQKLYEKGSLPEAREKLSKSKELLNLVKIYYPRNKDASLLSLKIDRMLNKETFEQTFAAKVQGLSQINYSDKSPVAMQSYTDMLDLYELNPSYPGLKSSIEKAEIALGLRQKPVSQGNNSQAAKLAQDAQKILNTAGRDSVMLEEAKKLAEKAMELNPQNSQAITILDEIALRTGSQSAVVLSAKDEAIYQEALTCLQKNQIIEASSRLNQLLSTESNTRSAKIIKLKKRIEALL